MYCKSCRSEYRLGIERCSDCGGELAPGDLPEPGRFRLKEPPPDPVTVFASRYRAPLAAARSLLEREEVPFFVPGEEPRGLFALRFVDDPNVEPSEIEVSAADAERARELLANVEPAETHAEAAGPDAAAETDAADAEAADAEPSASANLYRPPHAQPLSPLEGTGPAAAPVAGPWARTGFRVLVALEAVFTLQSWFIEPRWSREFPEPLWESVSGQFGVGPLEHAMAAVAPFFVALSLMASVGLLLFSRQARIVFAVVTAWWLAYAWLSGPGLSHGFSSFVGALHGMLTGALVALAFYGPIAQVFAATGATAGPRRRPGAAPTSPG